MDIAVPARTTSYLDWSDKGAATLVRYTIGLILILAGWLVLGGAIAVPFTLLGMTVLAGSAAGQTLGLAASFLGAAVTVPLVTRYLLKRPWWSFGFPERRIDWWAIGIGLTVGLAVSLFSPGRVAGEVQVRLGKLELRNQKRARHGPTPRGLCP